MSSNDDHENNEAPGALHGVRVIDLSRFIAGPYCAMLLGDMGADVVKIEPPERGEHSRSYGPFVNDESLYTMVFNRNKRSLTLDLRNESGKAVLAEMLKTADVLVENFKPGTLEKMGLGPAVLEELNPRLIVTRISGFGQSGSLAQQPCFDVIAQTMSGLMEITGDPDGRPTMAGTYVVDYTSGMYAAMGTLAALHTRHRTTRGQVVDVSLMDSALSMLMTAIPEQVLLDRTMTRRGNRDRYAAPANTFPTADGHWVHLVVAGDAMFSSLVAAMGDPALTRDDRFSDNAARLQHVEALEQIITDWTRKHATDALLGKLQSVGIPAAKVASVADLANSNLHRHRIISMNHKNAGEIPMQGFAVHFDKTPMQLRHAAPALGEHSESVLKDWLALSPGAIEELRQRHII